MITANSAIISTCGRYRYQLERSWAKRTSRKTTVVFVGLNPSTADATHNDPTIRKCIAYAQNWEFKRLIMVNLFAWRATDPNELYYAQDPIGNRNDKHLSAALAQSSLVVACWGEHGSILGRSDEFKSRFWRRLKCLAVNRSGEPTHPLYLPATLKPVRLHKNSTSQQ